LKNYKLTIQYDGTNYAGWQIQNNAITIQQTITEAIDRLTNKKVNLIGSGRTDSGVHAFGQIANFRTEDNIDTYKFKYSLNSILPSDISILKIEEVPENFHARFDAKRRIYFYLFSNQKSPFLNRYSYFYHSQLNCELLNKLSNCFIGEKDFSSFAKSGSDTVNKICNVYSINWKMTAGITIFQIEADRFLHGMVRSIIGTILLAAKENYNEKLIMNIFAEKDRRFSGMSVPAKGLFLYKVKYEK
jgi:tRNA pseudouridine38-40 synthase